MKHTLIILAILLLSVTIAGMYKFNYLSRQPGYDVDGNKGVIFQVEKKLTDCDQDQICEKPIDSNAQAFNITLDVNLSEEAQSKLTDNNEIYIVEFSATGIPLDAEKYKNSASYDNKFQKVRLGQKRFEVTESASFEINDTMMVPELYADVDMASVNLLVNVFSGRKSFENNILDCGTMQGNPKNISKNYVIECKML